MADQIQEGEINLFESHCENDSVEDLNVTDFEEDNIDAQDMDEVP